jgi:hypothetical protein
MFNKKHILTFITFALASNFAKAEVTQVPQETSSVPLNKALLIGAGACLVTAAAGSLATYFIKKNIRNNQDTDIEKIKKDSSETIAKILRAKTFLEEEKATLEKNDKQQQQQIDDLNKQLDDLNKQLESLKVKEGKIYLTTSNIDEAVNQYVEYNKKIVSILQNKKDINELSNDELDKILTIFNEAKNQIKDNENVKKIFKTDNEFKIRLMEQISLEQKTCDAGTFIMPLLGKRYSVTSGEYERVGDLDGANFTRANRIEKLKRENKVYSYHLEYWFPFDLESHFWDLKRERGPNKNQ